ncbi:carbohydrate ABC transporter permease [Candidatus Hydrogenedentota bacterium]
MKSRDLKIHAVLIVFVILTLSPFILVLNNSIRTNAEMYRSFLGVPEALKNIGSVTVQQVAGSSGEISLDAIDPDAALNPDIESKADIMSYSEAMKHLWKKLSKGYVLSWKMLRQYTLNTLVVCGMTVFGVVALGSISGYVFSRNRFPGRNLLFMTVLSFMMIPGILTLVPSFLLVKKLHLLNSYWVLILPYVAGGQVFSIFLFKTFFDGLPEELFESARIDGAGHWALYWNIVLPLSKPIISVVIIINCLRSWNNFLWPFIANTDPKYHVIASGIYLMRQAQATSNFSTLYAAYVLASLPLLLLFTYATKPFMRGMSSGAFKA